VPRGMAGGMTISLPEEDRSYASRSHMLHQIVSLLGGRVAEKLVLEDISTGASNDIERASEIARKMVTVYGMSEKVGTIAFGCSRGTFQRCGVFVLLSMALGGLVLSLGGADFFALLLSGCCLWGLCCRSLCGIAAGQEYLPLEIQNGEKILQLIALRDTGNTLCDPVTGRQALVISSRAASRLTGLTTEQLRNPLETMASAPVPGLRLLPFRTVGQGTGMMLAMWMERVTIRGKSAGALVAFAPEDFGSQKPYQALTGGAAW